MHIYQWKWATTSDLSKLLGTPVGLHLELQNVDQFIVDIVKAKLKYQSSTHLSLVGRALDVNHVLMSSLCYFIAVWASLKKVLVKIKALLRNYLCFGFENMARTRVSHDNCMMPKNWRP